MGLGGLDEGHERSLWLSRAECWGHFEECRFLEPCCGEEGSTLEASTLSELTNFQLRREDSGNIIKRII
jgi:hypothetical protein